MNIASTRLRRTIKASALWTKERDEALRAFVARCWQHPHGPIDWRRATVDPRLSGIGTARIADRWRHTLNPILKRGSWTLEEDQRLLEWVRANGAHEWSRAQSLFSGRTGKSLRERYTRQLRPEIIRRPSTPEEDAALISLQQLHGNRWVKIAEQFVGRTEHWCKLRWAQLVRKRAPGGEGGRAACAPSCAEAPEWPKSAPSECDDLWDVWEPTADHIEWW